uniref:F-box domain-containing protein n=1 Tax=Mycena chlorophos TaxID=658473 RepID=A0ABQ0LK28_MYCCL|nr:predicted protein [Mycena chlorophos]
MALPDELISLILEPALTISDHSFADNWSNTSPFAEYSESTSAYLVVCKSWLRVATPLLYGVVVLRSAAQTKALARALKGNPDLGSFVKKLRIEGGYGLAMHTVLQLSPKVTDLYLSLDIYASDKTEGLCKGLPLVNPRRLILQHSRDKQQTNKQFDMLFEVLPRIIRKWSNLTTLGIPVLWEFTMAFTNLRTLVKSLNRVQRIEKIAVPYCNRDIRCAVQWLHDCPIREIRILTPTSSARVEETIHDAELRALVKYSTIPEAPTSVVGPSTEIIPSLNPFFVPLANEALQTRDQIWSRVLSFAMPPAELVNRQDNKAGGVSLLLVCRDFYRLGLAHLCKDVVIRRLDHVLKLAQVLEAHPALGAEIRFLRSDLYHLSYGDPSDSDSDSDVLLPPPARPSTSDIASALQTMLSRVPNITEIDFLIERYSWSSNLSITWGAFVALASCAGSSLRSTSVSIRVDAADMEDLALGRPSPADVFGKLTAVSKLHWKSSVEFPADAELVGRLPSLEELDVEEAHKSFWTVFEAPQLRRLTIRSVYKFTFPSRAFFQTHVITDLCIPADAYERLWKHERRNVLVLCPDLAALRLTWTSLSFAMGPPPALQLGASSVAENLEVLDYQCGTIFFRSEKKNTTEWTKALTNLPLESMPKLTEIRVEGIKWPSTQHEIARSEWVRASEALAKLNVSLVDASGKKWRSRLKTNGRKAS